MLLQMTQQLQRLVSFYQFVRLEHQVPPTYSTVVADDLSLPQVGPVWFLWFLMFMLQWLYGVSMLQVFVEENGISFFSIYGNFSSLKELYMKSA
jgi:hypothetical protein